MDLRTLIQKYSRPGPRYTSYPTAPHWTTQVGIKEYEQKLKEVTPNEGLALYVHIPFCEALCYYCGCNIQITKDRTVGAPYVDALLTELENASKHAKNSGQLKLSQISWGGGTPTYLPTYQLNRLYQAIVDIFPVEADAEIAIEIDPRVTTKEQLQVLSEIGFNRVSLGVQDFDEEVQKAVNRIQSIELTADCLEYCRHLGFEGINLDLIYGLPLQTLDSFSKTIDAVISLSPDRIALYNYARLPTLRKHQGILEKYPMPNADERTDIFLLAFDRLCSHGYIPIGMDHFAKPTDELCKALEKRSLYRNFMGYTVKRGGNMIGIGASAIGEVSGAFFQNIRETKAYQEAITRKGLATFRGFELSREDIRRKWVIQNLMCRFQISFEEYHSHFDHEFSDHFHAELKSLETFIDDGLLEADESEIRVTERGQLFVRNTAMVFDEYLNKPQSATYSKTL